MVLGEITRLWLQATVTEIPVVSHSEFACNLNFEIAGNRPYARRKARRRFDQEEMGSSSMGRFRPALWLPRGGQGITIEI